MLKKDSKMLIEIILSRRFILLSIAHHKNKRSPYQVYSLAIKNTINKQIGLLITNVYKITLILG